MLKDLFKKTTPIEVFVRHCHYSDVSAHKARFPGFTREKCLQNLLATLQGEKKVNLTFLLDTHHPMEKPHFLHGQKKFPILSFKAGSEGASFLYMLEHVCKQDFSPETIIYFLEDDYLHRPHWPTALREAFTLPNIAYATLYDHKDKYFLPQYTDLHSRLFHTPSCHWRTTPSTTNTYAMRFQTLKDHIEYHREFSLGRKITADHEKFSKLAEQGALLVSSIPGFSTHAEPDYASPCVAWDEILK